MGKLTEKMIGRQNLQNLMIRLLVISLLSIVILSALPGTSFKGSRSGITIGK